jgi:hypothetical protein
MNKYVSNLYFLSVFENGISVSVIFLLDILRGFLVMMPIKNNIQHNELSSYEVWLLKNKTVFIKNIELKFMYIASYLL